MTEKRPEIARIIEMLEKMRLRPALFLGEASLKSLTAYLSGFDNALFIQGMKPPWEILQDAKVARGWKATNEVWPISEMRGRGLTELEMMDEILVIEIAYWRLAAERPGSYTG